MFEYLFFLFCALMVFLMVFPIFTLYARTRFRILLCTACFLVALGIFVGFSAGYKGDLAKLSVFFLIQGNLLFLLLSSIVSRKKYTSHLGLKSFLPLCVSLLGIFVAHFSIYLGSVVSLRVFYHRLDDYQSAVAYLQTQLTDDEIAISYEDMPHKYAHLARFVVGRKYASGDYTLDFRWERSSSYLYSSSGKLSDDYQHKNKRPPQKLAENWFKTYY